MRYEMIGDKKIGIIRPLLDVDRPEIEEYCVMRNLNPRIDHTNQETVYTRNKIRLMLLPLLEKNFNPAVVSTVGRLGKIASMDRDFLKLLPEMHLKHAGMKKSKHLILNSLRSCIHQCVSVCISSC